MAANKVIFDGTTGSPFTSALTINFRTTNLVLMEYKPEFYQIRNISESGQAKVAKIANNTTQLYTLRVQDLPFRSDATWGGMFQSRSGVKGLWDFITSASYADFSLNKFTIYIPAPNHETNFVSGISVRYWDGIESLSMSESTERWNGTLVFRREV